MGNPAGTGKLKNLHFAFKGFFALLSPLSDVLIIAYK